MKADFQVKLVNIWTFLLFLAQGTSGQLSHIDQRKSKRKSKF